MEVIYDIGDKDSPKTELRARCEVIKGEAVIEQI